jgi:hypothetical protein
MTMRPPKFFAKPIPDHPYHAKSSEALRYIIKDAGEAARNMRDVSYEAECKYLDQMNDACTILRYRRMLADVHWHAIHTNHRA